MQPELRMRKAPAPKRASKFTFGKQPAGALNAIDQVHGQ